MTGEFDHGIMKVKLEALLDTSYHSSTWLNLEETIAFVTRYGEGMSLSLGFTPVLTRHPLGYICRKMCSPINVPTSSLNQSFVILIILELRVKSDVCCTLLATLAARPPRRAKCIVLHQSACLM